MKGGTGENLDLSRDYNKKLFGPLFYSWWNCPLSSTNTLQQGCDAKFLALKIKAVNSISEMIWYRVASIVLMNILHQIFS